MLAVSPLECFFEQRAIGLVIHALAALFLHYLALGLDTFLFHFGMQHALRLQPQAQFQLIGGKHFVVEGSVPGGVGVQGAAGALDVLVEFAPLNIGGAFKEKMLKEMGKTGAIGFFIF